MLDYLEDDTRTLSSCARIHSSFLDSARRALYSTLSLPFLHVHAWLQPPKGVKLFQSLQQHPHLARLPREANVCLSIAGADNMRRHWSELGQEVIKTEDVWNKEWAARFSKQNGVDLKKRIGFALNLPKLQRLELSDIDQWYDFTRHLISHHLPSVDSLSLPAFSPDIALSFPNLRNLTTSFAGPVGTISPAGLVHITLTPLPRHGPPTSHSLSSFFAWLTSASTTSLTSLTIPFSASFAPNLGLFSALSELTLSSSKYGWGLSIYKPDTLDKLPATFLSFPSSLRILRIGRFTEVYPQNSSGTGAFGARPVPVPPTAATLASSFLANLSGPSLTTLLISGPELAPSVYTELVSNETRLPALRSVGVLAEWWGEHELAEREGVAWRKEEVKRLREVSEARGVRFEMEGKKPSMRRVR